MSVDTQVFGVAACTSTPALFELRHEVGERRYVAATAFEIQRALAMCHGCPLLAACRKLTPEPGTIMAGAIVHPYDGALYFSAEEYMRSPSIDRYGRTQEVRVVEHVPGTLCACGCGEELPPPKQRYIAEKHRDRHRAEQIKVERKKKRPGTSSIWLLNYDELEVLRLMAGRILWDGAKRSSRMEAVRRLHREQGLTAAFIEQRFVGMTTYRQITYLLSQHDELTEQAGRGEL